jgi:hypothetical protein
VPAYSPSARPRQSHRDLRRCEDEALCRAELLAMLDDIDIRIPKHLAGGPVHGYYDVDSAYACGEFLKPYRKDPARPSNRNCGPSPARHLSPACGGMGSDHAK